jgi:hypothetical protein
MQTDDGKPKQYRPSTKAERAERRLTSRKEFGIFCPFCEISADFEKGAFCYV